MWQQQQQNKQPSSSSGVSATSTPLKPRPAPPSRGTKRPLAVSSGASVISVGSVARAPNAFSGIFVAPQLSQQSDTSSVVSKRRRAAPSQNPFAMTQQSTQQSQSQSTQQSTQQQQQSTQQQQQSTQRQSQSSTQQQQPTQQSQSQQSIGARAPLPTAQQQHQHHQQPVVAGAPGANGRQWACLNDFLNAHTSKVRDKTEDRHLLTHTECHGPRRRLIVPPQETPTLNALFLKEVVHGVGAHRRRLVSHLVEYPFTRESAETPGLLAVDIDLKIDVAAYVAGGGADPGAPVLDAADGCTYLPQHLVLGRRHILPFVQAQTAELYRLLDVRDRDKLRVFVLQKRAPRATKDKDTGVPTQVYSDGIHMFVSVGLPMALHEWMYDRMVRWIESNWMDPASPHFLPGLTTDARQILDKNVYAGNTSVLKYGARKGDDSLVYALTGVYEFECSLLAVAAAEEEDLGDSPDNAPPPLDGPELVPRDDGTDWLARVLPSSSQQSTTTRRRAAAASAAAVLVFGPWRQTEEPVTRNTLRVLEERWMHLLSVRATGPDVLVRPVRAALAAAVSAFAERSARRFAPRAPSADQLRLVAGGALDAAALHRAQLADFAPEALLDMQTHEDVVRFMEIFRASISPADEATRLLLSYLFALPESFYGKGHYGERLRVGFALHDYSPKLLVVYLAFCAQREDFDFRVKVPLLVGFWRSIAPASGTRGPRAAVSGGGAAREGITARSIQFWCKAAAPEAFHEIRNSAFDEQVDQILSEATMANAKRKVSGTDVDKAKLLVRLAAGRFCCAEIRNKIWYEFRQHRWESMEMGYLLRDMIPEEMYDRCHARVMQLDEAHRRAIEVGGGPDSEQAKRAARRMEIALDIATSLKETKTINNVFNEAHSRLYERDFYDRMDANGYLVCFTNGVYDLREHRLREGQPGDCLSKSTGYAYVPLDQIPPAALAEYKAYLAALFPDPVTREYIEEFIAFTFVADAAINQCMHIFTGSGKNGKSWFLERFLPSVHGERASNLKSAFYTEKSGKMGVASQELFNTINCTYVHTDEFSEGDVLYDDQMKQMVGGVGLMEARLLYGGFRKFIPKASAVVGTNFLPKVVGTDDGVWRRLRIVECMVFYTETPDPANPLHAKCRSSKEMEALLERIQPVAAAVSFERLRARAARLDGDLGTLPPCPAVLRATNQYRQEQDLVAAFMYEKTKAAATRGVTSETEVKDVFQRWCRVDLGDESAAKRKMHEMVRRMSKTYQHTAPGALPKGWLNMRLLREGEAESEPPGFAGHEDEEEEEGNEERRGGGRKRARDETEQPDAAAVRRPRLLQQQQQVASDDLPSDSEMM
jgi:phage/plasmid-associated DNA primase